MVVWGWVGGALRVLLKIPKESSNHRDVENPPAAPSPTKKKSTEGDGRGWEFHEKPVRAFASCTHSLHTMCWLCTGGWGAAIHLDDAGAEWKSNSRSCAAERALLICSFFCCFPLSFLGSVVWTSTDLEKFRNLKGKKPSPPGLVPPLSSCVRCSRSQRWC